jgi:hypothetical protein
VVTDGSEAAAGRALRPPRPLMASGGRHAAVSVPRTKATAGPLPLGPAKDTRRRAGACGRWAAIDAVPWPLVVILGAQVVVARHVLRHLGRHRRLLLLSRRELHDPVRHHHLSDPAFHQRSGPDHRDRHLPDRGQGGQDP